MALGNRNPQLDLGLRCSPMADGRMAHGRCTHQYRTYSSMLFRYFKQRLLTYLGTLNWRGLSNWAGSPGLRKHSCGFRIRYFWFEPRESRNSPGSLIMRIVLLKAKSQKWPSGRAALPFLVVLTPYASTLQHSQWRFPPFYH